ncbi:MAG TPA: hypothetical protein VHQ47_20840 [Phycisphaerae bacterium]|jgi:hypothetical protein|nr:hypothetical protein [Phycisphaerae bacterium]
MAKWKDHRQAVHAALERRGKTKYWLADQLAAVMSKSTLYRYLGGESDLSYEKRKAVDEFLGIRYTDE